jgi:serine/threonine protein kinase
MYDNAIALVMEYASGGELRDYIDTKKSLSEDETRNIFNQLVSAMCFCHSMKVVHRDLKLENILFSTEKKDQIKIVDFGISGYYDIEDKTNAGSLRYLPPEIISQTRLDANPAIDVWSMGCILYYLINGRHPFSSKESKELKEKIKKGAYEIPQGNSFYLKALIRRMLDIDFHSRITLDEVMQHPWFLGETPPPITLNATPIQTHVGANHHKTLTKPSLINNGEPKYQSFASFKSKMNYRTNYTGFYHRDKDDPINEYSLYHCALDIPQFRRPIHHTKEQKRHLNMIFEITKKRAPSLCIYATTDGNNHNTKSAMKMRNTAYSKWGKNKHVIIK